VTALAASAAPDFHAWAPKPPMGWNSWDCFATTVTEAQARAQADFMAEKLARFGWAYLTVDIQWYEPDATGYDYRKGAPLAMDEFGRLLPAVNRFPSSAGGAGFKPLGDYLHAKGLKFGLHLMRGIPRQAVAQNTAILGSSAHAADIADRTRVCRWNNDMFGVDMSKPGAQEYYDSVFALLASWGVDFVKVDDLSRPYEANRAEVEAVRKAIDRTGRPMVLSLSPGETPLAVGATMSRPTPTCGASATISGTTGRNSSSSSSGCATGCPSPGRATIPTPTCSRSAGSGSARTRGSPATSSVLC
jgi:hypothetical protein